MSKQSISSTKALLQIGTAAALLIGLCSDFFLPSSAGFVIGLLLFLLCLLLTIFASISSTNKLAKQYFGPYWFRPIVFTLLALSITGFTSHYLSKRFSDNRRGILATSIPEFASLQTRLRLSDRKIEATAHSVVEEKSAHVLDDRGEPLNDAQLELQNLDLNWTQDDFLTTLIVGDLYPADLYFRGGMRLEKPGSESKNHPFLDVIAKNRTNIKDIYEIISKYQVLDLNGLYEASSQYAHTFSEVPTPETTTWGPLLITPLIASILENNFTSVRWLLERDADTTKAGRGYTVSNEDFRILPINAAYKAGNDAVIELIATANKEKQPAMPTVTTSYNEPIDSEPTTAVELHEPILSETDQTQPTFDTSSPKPSPTPIPAEPESHHYQQVTAPSYIEAYIKNIQSENAATKRDVAIKIYKKNTFHPAILSAMEHELLAGSQSDRNDSTYIDALSWYCRVLGKTRNRQYANTLRQVISNTYNKKLQKYARRSLNQL